jgi:peptide/nickel transport system ATP-binding protein
VVDSAVIRCEDLHLVLDSATGPVHALRGVSIAVRRGALVAVVGESGSGKTMLARTIVGVLPHGARVQGRAFFDGIDLTVLPERSRRAMRGRDIAMVLQDPMSALDPVMRVGGQIAELLRVHQGMGRAEAWARSRELLAEVGIADAARRTRQYPHELSGGMRQRVAIAMALACEPTVLIADEPTSALDVTVQAQILDLLQRLRRERDLTVILITHDLGIVAQYADEVIVMRQGQVVERAMTDRLFDAPSAQYTRDLLAAVPRL